jgi:hypothetical protein
MLTRSIVDGFAKELHGRLIRPEDEEYEDMRKVWNGLIDSARC